MDCVEVLRRSARARAAGRSALSDDSFAMDARKDSFKRLTCIGHLSYAKERSVEVLEGTARLIRWNGVFFRIEVKRLRVVCDPRAGVINKAGLRGRVAHIYGPNRTRHAFSPLLGRRVRVRGLAEERQSEWREVPQELKTHVQEANCVGRGRRGRVSPESRTSPNQASEPFEPVRLMSPRVRRGSAAAPNAGLQLGSTVCSSFDAATPIECANQYIRQTLVLRSRE